MAVVERKSAESKWYVPGILQGLAITIKHMFFNLTHRRSMFTIEYPEERYPYSERFKGNHILTVKKDGSLRCTACMLCATNCPAECISITASEHDDPNVEKFPISYEIDILRCVFCGYCEEACPVDAVRMGRDYEMAELAERNFVVGIDYLMNRPKLEGKNISVFHEPHKITGPQTATGGH
jgi:NADH-quinone oxidoreductase subunit I